MINDEAYRLADRLANAPRDADDANAAFMLRLLARVYEVAREMILTNDETHAIATYDELVDLIKGRPDR